MGRRMKAGCLVGKGGRSGGGSAGQLGDRGPGCAAPAPRGGGCRVPGITDGLGILASAMVSSEIHFVEKMRIGVFIGKKCEEEG